MTAPALACPPRDACLVSLRSTSKVAAPAPQADAVANVRRALQLPVAKKPTGDGVFEGIEIPWIWRALREQVYSRMPTYEGSKDDAFKLVLAPVVVTSPSDTIPGVGVSGDF